MHNIKQISDLFDALPDSIKMIVYEGTLDEELEDIAEENQITPIDLEKIKGEVLLIIIGTQKFESLKNKLLTATTLGNENLEKVCQEIKDRIITPIDEEIKNTNNSDLEKIPNKEDVLNEIENPVPAKPAVSNPAGKNIVLDAQHNLPEQEKKILISSAAVPSRGPLLGNFANGFVMKTTTPSIPKVIPVIPSQPVPPKPSIQPQSVQQIPKPPVQNPISTVPTQNISKPTEQKPPEAPKKYSIDPYREPIE